MRLFVRNTSVNVKLHFKLTRAQRFIRNHVTKEPWPLWFLPTYQKFKTGAILTYNLLNKQGEYTMWSGICTVKAAGELCRDRNCHCKVGFGFGIDHPDPKSQKVEFFYSIY